MKKLIFIMLFLLLILSGCASNMMEVKQLPPFSFEQSKPYSIDLSQIDKPKPLQPQYGKINSDGTITIITREQLENKDVIVLNLEEYKKVAELVNLCITYKTIILQQEVLINEKIKIENGLKEIAEIERIKSNEVYQMWAESENAYRNEIRERRNDNLVNKIFQGILSGAIIVLAL